MWDALNGKGASLESGDFKNCSYWGARTDDFLEGKNEIDECFPSEFQDQIAAASGYREVTHKLEFFGVCPACQSC